MKCMKYGPDILAWHYYDWCSWKYVYLMKKQIGYALTELLNDHVTVNEHMFNTRY